MQSMTEGFFNPSALYAPALLAERAYTAARKTIADSLHASEKNVIFTSGGTESDNLAILGYLQTVRGGEVLYTAAEHAAVKNACAEAALRCSMTAREIPLTREGSVDISALEGMLSDNTRMLCVMQVCNETGAVMPLKEICALRDRLSPRVVIHVDGVQGYLRLPFSFKEYGVQSYALSGHKIHAPKGVGALVYADGIRLHPQIVGGGQQNNLRSGTENTGGVAGLQAAAAHFPADALEHMRALKAMLLDKLSHALPECTLIGPPVRDASSAPHILSVAFPPVRAETLLHALEEDGIFVGTGSACSSKKGKRSSVLTAMGLKPDIMDGAIRISLCPYNTEAEMLYTAEKLIQKVETLRRYARR